MWCKAGIKGSRAHDCSDPARRDRDRDHDVTVTVRVTVTVTVGVPPQLSEVAFLFETDWLQVTRMGDVTGMGM